MGIKEERGENRNLTEWGKENKRFKRVKEGGECNEEEGTLGL